ncbi:hypothetical protein D3C87_1323410 [compost metagenome]
MVEALSEIQYRNPKTLEETTLLFQCDSATRTKELALKNYNADRAAEYTKLQEMQALALKVAKAYVKMAL